MPKDKINLIIDTREQQPLPFHPTGMIEGVKSKKLNCGDYSIEGYENEIAVERKSPSDLFGTLGKGHTRFKKELQRAKDYDYFAIIVETPFFDVYEKCFEGAEYSSMAGDVIIKQCFTIKFKYGVDVIFCNNRSEASAIIRQIFRGWLKSRKT